MRRFLFFGKGGAGKTTLASVIGIKLSALEKTYLVSLDPAHNLFDVFQVERRGESYQVSSNLTITEFDIPTRAQQVLKDTAEMLKNRFRYFETMRLERVIDMMANAPGSEEFVYVNVLFEIVNKSDGNIVLDFPPTGIAMRILTLPFTSIEWAKTLFGLRKQIVQLQKTIARLHGQEITQDEVLVRLIQYQQDLKNLIDWLLDKKTVCMVVAQPDPLSIFEGKNIIKRLKSMGFPNIWLICNRCKSTDVFAINFEDIKGISTFLVQESEFIPVGLDSLKEFPLPEGMVEALRDPI